VKTRAREDRGIACTAEKFPGLRCHPETGTRKEEIRKTKEHRRQRTRSPGASTRRNRKRFIPRAQVNLPNFRHRRREKKTSQAARKGRASSYTELSTSRISDIYRTRGARVQSADATEGERQRGGEVESDSRVGSYTNQKSRTGKRSSFRLQDLRKGSECSTVPSLPGDRRMLGKKGGPWPSLRVRQPGQSTR